MSSNINLFDRLRAAHSEVSLFVLPCFLHTTMKSFLIQNSSVKWKCYESFKNIRGIMKDTFNFKAPGTADVNVKIMFVMWYCNVLCHPQSKAPIPRGCIWLLCHQKRLTPILWVI